LDKALRKTKTWLPYNYFPILILTLSLTLPPSTPKILKLLSTVIQIENPQKL
jgi:hypothetical protein